MKQLFIALMALLFFACKHDNEMADIPVITINTPVENQHYSKGEIVKVTGKVTSAIPLTEVGVHMTNAGNEFFHNHFSANNQQEFIIDVSYTVVETTAASFIIEIAADNANGFSIKKLINVKVN